MTQEEQNAPTDEKVPESPATDAPATETPVAESPTSADGASAVELSSGPLHGLIGALLAAVVTWAVLHAIYPVFFISEELQAVLPTGPPETLAKQEAALEVAATQNTVLAYGLLGLSLGVFLVGIDSLVRGRFGGAILFGLLGGLIVGVAGCASGWAGVLMEAELKHSQQYSPLMKTILLQAATLGIIGVGLGISLALPYRRAGLFVSCILGCVFGAVLAALVYPVAMSTLAPIAHTESLVPYVSWTRFAWLAISAALIGLVVTGVGRRKPKPAA